MRLKTFIATYLLFLFILFSSVSIVSVYLNSSQIAILKDKSTSQFQAIIHTLIRDIAISSYTFNTVDSIVNSYARYYSKHNVGLSISDLTQSDEAGENIKTEIKFINQDDSHYINISGLLPKPYDFYLLSYSFNVTESISDMRNIQKILIIAASVLSFFAAFALFFILSAIFKPLGIVAVASKKIANGEYSERINIQGKNEIAQVAYDFNIMAEKIERQIIYLEEEAENKQQFVDNFAHEIRTPLTSIYGYAEYMQKTALDEKEVIESSTYIMNEASHIKMIADSLLELATLRDYIPVKVKICVAKLFNDIVNTLERPLGKKGVRLIINSNAGIFFGQEDLIKSLLLNLCINALNACTEGEGLICLDAGEESGKLKISVTDNGCGIPEECLYKISEPFYRLDTSRSRENGGAGLGLTLCNQIAAVHNARMMVRSVVNQGTCVEIKFTTS